MRGGRLIATCALLAVLAVPVLLVDVPVGVDTLAHLARLHVRAHLGIDPDLAQLFALRPGLIPYLGMDWLLSPLVQVMPALQVGRIATVLCVWSTVGMVAVLAWAFTGRVGVAPLLGGVVAWNGLTAWGFLPYLFGVALAIAAFALWHRLRGRPAWQRLLLFGAATTGLYLVHLLALVLYGGLVGLHALLFGTWRPRYWPVLVLQFVPPVVLWVVYNPPVPQGSLGILYNLPTALIALASPTLFPGALGAWESGHLVLLAGGAGLIVATRRGLITWDRQLLIMAGVLWLVGLALPVAAVGVSWINLRVPLVAACFALAAVRLGGSAPLGTPSVTTSGTPSIILWSVALAGLVLVRTASVASTMVACAPDYAALRRAMQALPRGAVLTPVLEREAPVHSCSWLPVYEHAADLVTLERAGLATDFFTRTMSVAGRGAPTDIKAVEMGEVTPGDLGQFVLWMHLGRAWPLPAGAVVLAREPWFDLLRIDSGPMEPVPARDLRDTGKSGI